MEIFTFIRVIRDGPIINGLMGEIIFSIIWLIFTAISVRNLLNYIISTWRLRFSNIISQMIENRIPPINPLIWRCIPEGNSINQTISTPCDRVASILFDNYNHMLVLLIKKFYPSHFYDDWTKSKKCLSQLKKKNFKLN